VTHPPLRPIPVVAGGQGPLPSTPKPGDSDFAPHGPLLPAFSLTKIKTTNSFRSSPRPSPPLLFLKPSKDAAIAVSALSMRQSDQPSRDGCHAIPAGRANRRSLKLALPTSRGDRQNELRPNSLQSIQPNVAADADLSHSAVYLALRDARRPRHPSNVAVVLHKGAANRMGFDILHRADHSALSSVIRPSCSSEGSAKSLALSSGDSTKGLLLTRELRCSSAMEVPSQTMAAISRISSSFRTLPSQL
jgi:hypothetical protein